MSSRTCIPTPSPGENDTHQGRADKPLLDRSGCCHPAQYERKMGDTELSYFLPSRQTGVNDMYLHLGFDAPTHLLRFERVRLAWAIIRLRHSLLSAKVEMHDYDDVRFVYETPTSPEDVLASADAALEFRSQTKDELVDSYLNGPRTLSNCRLSFLILSQPASSSIPTPPRTPSPVRDGLTSPVDNSESVDCEADGGTTSVRRFDMLLASMHYLGDGMALHQCANDFFRLIAGGRDDQELTAILHDEWRGRFGAERASFVIALPMSLEARLPESQSRLHHAVTEIDFQLLQSSSVGGQTFPRRKDAERHTVLLNVVYHPDRTKAMLKKCKQHGVSISAALFALCNVAWARMGGGKREHPAMMYSALNLRPYFKVERQEVEQLRQDSYFFLAISYFNVILPNFVPSGDQERTFWLRARSAKAQSIKAVKNKLVVSRARNMASDRAQRARAWGKEDDEKERGTWAPSPAPTAPTIKDCLPARSPAPSAALMGLSLLGNLDGIYAHASYPEIKLHTLTTGSRQRHGGMLLFGYTFADRLWVSLGYDENGFADGVVERFWGEILRCTEEFLW